MDIIEYIRSIPNLLSLSEVNDSDIESAEQRLNLHFSDEYRKYTQSFGAISTNGKQITGVVSFPDIDVVSVTESAREISPNVPYSWYVVYDPHIDGIMYWQDSIGTIYRTSPQVAPIKIADSLADFITT